MKTKLITALFVLFGCFISCKKSEVSQVAPKIEIINIQAYYPGFDTLQLPIDTSVFTVDTSGFIQAVIKINTANDLQQISATETGNTTNFSLAGFSETSNGSKEYIKLNGFENKVNDLFTLKITADSLHQSTITLQVFDDQQLSSSANLAIKIAADTTLYK